jgi:hypothetical protein
MKKQLLIITFVMVLISLTAFVSANDLTFKQGQDIDIKVPCYINGSYCSAGATCSITIQYPNNGTLLVNNQAMTYNPSYFNYTLNSSQTRVIGSYPCSMVCVDGSDSGYRDFPIEITTTGANNELMINIIAFIIIAFAIVMLVLGINKQDWIITMLSSFLFAIAGIQIYFYPMVYLPSFVNSALAWILWGVGGYILLRTAIEAGGSFGN